MSLRFNPKNAEFPYPYTPHDGMIQFELCHGPARACPNLLINPNEWRQVIEDYLYDKEIGRRLRERIPGEQVLHHQKLHISISGCPNACSRPQIADIGIVGFVRPRVDTRNCTQCGLCESVCPDGAVTLDDGPPCFDRSLCQGCKKCTTACDQGCFSFITKGAKLLVGGRLGRRPAFARQVSEVETPEIAVKKIDKMLDEFIERAKPGQRFADYINENTPLS